MIAVINLEMIADNFRWSCLLWAPYQPSLRLMHARDHFFQFNWILDQKYEVSCISKLYSHLDYQLHHTSSFGAREAYWLSHYLKHLYYTYSFSSRSTSRCCFRLKCSLTWYIICHYIRIYITFIIFCWATGNMCPCALSSRAGTLRTFKSFHETHRWFELQFITSLWNLKPDSERSQDYWCTYDRAKEVRSTTQVCIGRRSFWHIVFSLNWKSCI